MKLIFEWLVFLLAITCVLNVQQLYIFLHERCDVSFNKEMVYNFSYKCYKLSRKELYLNLSLSFNNSVEGDKDAQVHITGYQLRSNEYRKGPIEFRLDFCSAANRKDFDIPSLLSQSNAKCPITKFQHIYVNKIYPNATNFPPLIPEGRWKLSLEFIYRKTTHLFTVNWYAKVEYPVRING